MIMRDLMKHLAMFSVLSFVVVLAGNEMERPQFSPVEVKIRLEQAPRIKAGAVSSAARGNVSLANRRWGVIEILYKPHFGVDGQRNRRKNASAGVWLDNVICGVQVVACDRQARKNPSLALFSTRVEFWTIPLDWREHRYFVYIPPMLIERVMPSRRAEGRSVKVATYDDFVVCVTFFHKKWGVLGEGIFGLKGKTARADFAELLKGVPTSNIFHGSLVSRANSPWGLNDQSQFDLEKPAFIPAPLDDAAIDKAAKAAVKEEAAFAEKSEKSSKTANGRKNKKKKR